TVDFKEKDDPAALARLKSLVGLLPAEVSGQPSAVSPKDPEFPASKIYEWVSADGRKEYDVRELMKCLVDAGSIDEYKADYGKSIVCAFARLGGRPVGIVANQRQRVQSKSAGLQMPGVVSADRAAQGARFIMDC